mgnify:CR=1 FL=1
MLLNKIIPIFLLVLLQFNNAHGEVLVPSESDKQSLAVYLVMDPDSEISAFTRDIDNNLTFSSSNYNVQEGRLEASACMLTNIQIGNWDYLGAYYKKEDENLYLVNSVYEQYGIKNLAKILAKDSEVKLEEYAASLNMQLEVNTFCENTTQSNGSYLYNKDMFFIPHYLYVLLSQLQSQKINGITQDSLLISYTFDEIKAMSEDYELVVADQEKTKAELMSRYESLANTNSKEYIGSLFVALEDYNQSFCTLDYSGADGIAAIGYRLLGDSMLADPNLINYLEEKNISLNLASNENKYSLVFENINEAYGRIRDRFEADDNPICTFFIDYPANLMKLSAALLREGYIKRPIFGKLLSEQETGDLFAKNEGFENYRQYRFAGTIGASMESIAALDKFGIKNLETFASQIERMNSSGYVNGDAIPDVLAFSKDEIIAKEKQTTALIVKNEREEKKRIEEQKRIVKRQKDINALKKYLDLSDYEFKVFEASGIISIDEYEKVKNEMQSSAFGDFLLEYNEVFVDSSVKAKVQQYLRASQFASMHNLGWFDYFSKNKGMFFPFKDGSVNGQGRYYLTYVSGPSVHSSGQMVFTCYYENGEEMYIGTNLLCGPYVFR